MYGDHCKQTSAAPRCSMIFFRRPHHISIDVKVIEHWRNSFVPAGTAVVGHCRSCAHCGGMRLSQFESKFWRNAITSTQWGLRQTEKVDIGS